MKFILTDEKHKSFNAFRITAAEDSDILGIKSGDLGGFIESKDNLDETGNAWVYPDSVVIGTSLVTGDAVIKNGAIIKDTTIGLGSSISDVSISNAMFQNEVKIYGKENSIVISDTNLKYRSITASKVPGITDDVKIGYSTFFGNVKEFNKFIEDGKSTDDDAELLNDYIKVIQSRFSPIE